MRAANEMRERVKQQREDRCRKRSYLPGFIKMLAEDGFSVDLKMHTRAHTDREAHPRSTLQLVALAIDKL